MKKKMVSIKPNNSSAIESIKLNVMVQFKEQVDEKVSREMQLKNLDKQVGFIKAQSQ
jgi:hypothetical protein